MCELVDEAGARRRIRTLQTRNRELREEVKRLLQQGWIWQDERDRAVADAEFAASLLRQGFGWDGECANRLAGYLE